MRKIIYLLVLVCSFGYGQETEFKFSKDGFTDYVITECEGKTAAELYKKVIDWVSVTYKNPKEVLKAQIENDYVRIEGFSDSLLCFRILGSKTFYDATYQIQISVKDGKYKFDVIEVNMINTKSDPHIELVNMKEYYKDSGDIKGNYKYFLEVFPAFFNNLNNSLKDFILTKKKDW